jgi:hypothetical protein
VESALPYPCIQKVFDDPTGVRTIINKDKHLGPNRFFSHYFLHKTFRKVPLFLQNFCNPIDSIYYTAAIAKMLMLIALLILLASIINGNFNFFSIKFTLTIAFLIPFFQVNGKKMANEIGIIDGSVTYNFFYALPMVFLLLYYIPIFFELMHNKKINMNWFLIILWIIFAIISCFSGPLIPPVILITNFILLFYMFVKGWRYCQQSLLSRFLNALKTISKRNYLLLIPVSFLALYSLYLGTFNSAYSNILSLKNLYALLPEGILKSFTSTSYLIISFLLIINYVIVFFIYKSDPQTKKVFGLYRFYIAFAIIYILLLPLGGYRPYRQLIIRYDTIIPITTFSMITICYGFIFIAKKLLSIKRTYYLVMYILTYITILAIFTHNNKVHVYNNCEKSSLHIIAQSEDEVVALHNNCAVIAWDPISDPKESKNLGKMIYLWNITDKPKLYYNLP